MFSQIDSGYAAKVNSMLQYVEGSIDLLSMPERQAYDSIREIWGRKHYLDVQQYRALEDLTKLVQQRLLDNLDEAKSGSFRNIRF